MGSFREPTAITPIREGTPRCTGLPARLTPRRFEAASDPSQNRLKMVKLLLSYNIDTEALTDEEEWDALDLAEQKVGGETRGAR
eukprot:169868-Hanusia_phi.AAC.4